jgi:lysophospholipase L1-like esterase
MNLRKVKVLVLVMVFVAANYFVSGMSILTAYGEETTNNNVALQGDAINVVFFGGSITLALGTDKPYANVVGDYLKSEYPDQKVNLYNSGIGGLGSSFGVQRVNEHVSALNPDIVFVEFAVNDRIDAKSNPNTIKEYMEGIVRQLISLPKIPVIIFLYTASRDFDACSDVHREVASYYDIQSIDLQEYLKSEIDAGKCKVEDYIQDTVHPNSAGQRLYGDYIVKKINSNKSKYLKIPKLQEKPMTKGIFNRTRFIDFRDKTIKYNGNWSVYTHNYPIPMADAMISDTIGDSFEVDFYGKSLGLWGFISKRGGNMEVSIDGKVATIWSQLHQTSENKTPLGVKLVNGLSDGWHKAVIKNVENPGGGTEINIGFLYVDDPKAQDSIAEKLKSQMVLCVGSGDAYVNNEKINIDQDHPEVVPVVKNGRTLVPVRFISESTGAKVNWDENTKKISITHVGKEIEMTLGSNVMKVNNEEIKLDVPPTVENNRTFIPLRALVEALGKNVYWDGKRIILIGDEKIDDSTGMSKAMLSKINKYYDEYKAAAFPIKF